MEDEQCDYLLPAGGPPGAEGEPCLLKQGHAGAHLICVTRVWEYWYEWESSPENCECTDEDLYNEICQCFVYGKIEDDEAHKRIKEEGPTS